MKMLLTGMLAGMCLLQGKVDRSVKQFKWLEGEWKLEKQQVYERWTIVNDSLMKGKSYHCEKKKEVTDERIQISLSGGEFYYIPTVSAQNNAQPVKFRLTDYTDTSFIAENPLHDFPQQIGYQRHSKDAVYAYIKGVSNGKEKKVDFWFYRAK